MKLIIGTSGYSYEDWRGVFYPQDLQKGKMLDYYSQYFPAVEINSTYYSIPHPAVFFKLAEKTPPNFEFIVKANQETTHRRQKNSEAMKKLIDAVQPLQDTDKLSGFLAQFPFSFKNTPENRKYLIETKKIADTIPLFIEFRNWTWDEPEIHKFLAENGLLYVNVDQPLLRGLLKKSEVVTGDMGYIRFHGRNESAWWRGTNQTRYNYLYSEAELDEWMKHISHILKKTYKSYIFFNNHPQGKAIQNAQLLKKMVQNQLDFLQI